MSADRRTFLKEAGCAVLGLGCGLPLVKTAFAVTQHGGDDNQLSASQWAMVVDLKKCLNAEVRAASAEACHREHNVPDIPDPEDEIAWIWEEKYRDVFPDQVHEHSPVETREMPVLVLCNHCTNPPCVRVCPTEATWKRESDGLVMMDQHRCIGCRYCMAACPYGSRSFNWRDPRSFIETDENGEMPSDFPTRTKGVVEKCNFCAERLRDGREPACVEAVKAVPGGEGALTFGNLADPDSEVNRILGEKHTIARRVSLGTGPNVFYIV
jgi:molybdopterin-containing oxidoreductase family iron-sulfur binding subunit